MKKYNFRNWDNTNLREIQETFGVDFGMAIGHISLRMTLAKSLSSTAIALIEISEHQRIVVSVGLCHIGYTAPGDRGFGHLTLR